MQLHTLRLFLDNKEQGDPAVQLAGIPKGARIFRLIVVAPSNFSDGGSLDEATLSPFCALLLPALQRAFLLHILHQQFTGGTSQLQHVTGLEIGGVR